MRLNKTIRLLLAGLTFLFFVNYTQAQTFESLEQIRTEVSDFLNKQYHDPNIQPEININQLDNRLKLKKCAIPLEYSIKSGARRYGNITVFTQCKGENPWSLYIPATVTGYEHVLTAKQGIFRGTIIGAQHLQLKKIDLSKAYYGFYTKNQEVIGLQASRSIPSGAIISKLFLELPDIIKKGQEVFIQAKTKGINIQLKGKALKDGKLGQLIQVRNISSGKVIQGKVISSTKVEVSLN